jgi:hypothetical protein
MLVASVSTTPEQISGSVVAVVEQPVLVEMVAQEVLAAEDQDLLPPFLELQFVTQPVVAVVQVTQGLPRPAAAAVVQVSPLPVDLEA